MDPRKEQLLKLVIETYIKTAEPVGSKLLFDSGVLNVSGATIRNEMNELEEEGYLTHPHTSAGRIPTEKGYKFYVESLLAEREKGSSPSDLKRKIKEPYDLRELGKQSAAVSRSAVVIAIGRDVYCTGTSYLYAQPEFEDVEETVQVSSIFDHFEDHVRDFFDRVPQGEERVFVGSENPFGGKVSTVIIKTHDDVLFGFVGPMRMDYKNNIALIEYIQNIIENNQKFLN